MFRLFGAVVAMAIPIAHAGAPASLRQTADEPVEVCEALPNDLPIEQSLVTDPTVRHPVDYRPHDPLQRRTAR
jgi:hypothetical protein